MKKLYFLICLCLTAGLLSAQVSKTVTATAGNLRTAFTTAEWSTVTNLTVTGTIDARDFQFMRDTLSVLSVLDLSAVTINAVTTTDIWGSLVTNSANGIPQYAFFNQMTGYSMTSLKSVILPTSITSIGDYAFRGCLELTGSLTIPNSVTTIGSKAFFECRFSGSLTIGSAVTSIGNGAFGQCYFNIINSLNATPPTLTSGFDVNYNSVAPIVYVPATGVTAYKAASIWSTYTIVTEKRVTINNATAGGLAAALISGGFGPLSSITHLTITGNLNSVDIAQIKTNMTVLTELDLSGASIATNILPAAAFQSKTTLTVVKLPESLVTISDNAFNGCSALTGSVPLPASLTSIGSSAFSGCNSLTGSLIIPNTVTSIGDNAFNYCSGLKGNLTIGNAVTSIGGSAFYGCTGLTGSLTIPNTVTSIGGSAFDNCSSLNGNLIIGNAVTAIGYDAFSSCTGLTGSLTIPNSVTSIGDQAFYNCAGFTDSLTIGNSVTSIGSNAFSGCIGLSKALAIPVSVTSIGSSAFYGCLKLTEVDINKNTTTIGDQAFYNCTGLQKISVARSVPPTIYSNTFNGVNKETCSLVVPIGAGVSYQTADYWSSFVFVTESASADTYAITLQIGTGGTVTESNMSLGNGSILTVNKGTTKTFTFTPNAGYQVATLTYNGADIKSQLVNNQYTTAAVNANATLIVTFQKAQYQLSIKSAESGTVNLLCEYGATPSFNFTATTGWKVNTVLYNGTDVTSSLVNGVYTVPAVSSDALLTVSFELGNALTVTSYSNVKVYTSQSEIIVEGTSEGEAVSIYTLGGVQLQTLKSQGERLAIKAEQGAVYLVRTASKTVKVVL
jgi:hypothetical protein